MKLVKIGKKDVSATARLLREYWETRGMKYSQKWAEGYVSKGHKAEIKEDLFFALKDGEKVLGTIAVIIYEGDVAELRDFVVDREHRGKGLGHKIISESLTILKEKKVRKAYALIFRQYADFYKEFGFEKEGVMKSHFAEGEDLVIVSKFL
jgi:N-acetylglutamate synthase-like GNAT family acetyltransferase